jgi:PIN domain nuclease of toxin-antitoxin system
LPYNDLGFYLFQFNWQFNWLKYLRNVGLNLPIILESTRLSGFHADPADQIIVATAKINALSLITQDEKILTYFKNKTP